MWIYIVHVPLYLKTGAWHPSYEELAIVGSFMRNLIRYMDLQPKDGGQDRDTHFPRGSRSTW